MTYAVGETLSKTPLAMAALVPADVTAPVSTAAGLAFWILVSSAGVGMASALPPAKVKNVPDELTIAPSAFVARAVRVVPAAEPTSRPPRLGTRHDERRVVAVSLELSGRSEAVQLPVGADDIDLRVAVHRAGEDEHTRAWRG